MSCKRFLAVIMGIAAISISVFGQCLPATSLTAYLAPGNTNIWLHFSAPAAGRYRVWTTTDQSINRPFPGTWLVATELNLPAGNAGWTDPEALVPYKCYRITAACGQTDSPPSNEVGYVKIRCNGGTSAVYTAFGLPFKFWTVQPANSPVYGTESRKPSSIIGTQTTCGDVNPSDRIVRQDVGRFAYRNVAFDCGWAGQLEANPADVEPGRAYWYRNNSGANRTLILVGEADTTAVGVPTVMITGPSTQLLIPTPYSWRYPRAIPIDRLQLLEQGFTGGDSKTSDKVLSQIGGLAAVYHTGTNSWRGSLTAVSPGNAYWIQNKHPRHNWTYTFHPVAGSQ
ncbi:MAG TPA: hypothetical protein VGL38_00625 [bacterium]|jgi:hypothetical protein